MSRVPQRLALTPAARIGAGIMPNERHAHQSAIVQRAFEQELMIAHEVAVIAGKHDHRVFIEPERFQPTQNAADSIVDHRNHAVGERDRLFRFALADGKGALAISVALVLRALVVEIS